MNERSEFPIEIDSQGRGILPPEVVSRYGLRRGTKIYLENGGNGLDLGICRDPLSKVYIEPTNRCNLECRTCMRNIWDEPLGQMDSSTFTRILEGLGNISPPLKIFFGGIGEPLAHPRIAEMVKKAKKIGSSVELITNGTLLTPDMSRRLLDAGLNMLWVSLDGATPESYADVRLGSALPEVLANITAFRKARQTEYTQRANLSPCLPLLHSHNSFLDRRERFSRRHIVGNVNKKGLQDLWRDPQYAAFRERVRAFNFSPCAICGGCEMGEGNEEDCFGNDFPTCGGCLWAQGVVQCP